MILFLFFRGTPAGSAVPTVKISSNKYLSEKKKNWIDFDSSPILENKNVDNNFFEYIIKVASGEKTLNEINGYKEISIFKDGVTL